MPVHENLRLRHPVRFRQLQVLRTETLTPHMRRIVVGGKELQGFHSAAPDDHVKLFFPNAQGRIVTPEMGPDGPRYPQGVQPSPSRDYTPRAYDAARGELVLDFVLHGDGVASGWAAAAAPGDTLVVGGPRGSFVVADDYDALVLLGDETALPAIARWLEELDGRTRAQAFIEIAGAEDRQALPVREGIEVTWLERDGLDPASSTLLEDALHALALPAGETFFWIATESRRARAMRKTLEQRPGVDADSIRATGYWKAGAEDGVQD